MLNPSGISWYLSPITRRILAVNVAALLILAAGLFYSGQYERQMVAAAQRALVEQGKFLTAAMAEGGMRENAAGFLLLADDLLRPLVRKMVTDPSMRILVIDKTGKILLDNRQFEGPGGVVEVENLNPPRLSSFAQWREVFFAWTDFSSSRASLMPFPAHVFSRPADHLELVEALQGAVRTGVWHDTDGKTLITTSLPIQSLKSVQGAVLIVRHAGDIDAAIGEVRATVLRFFLWAFLVTILFSVYLSETISQPLQRLATAARKVRVSLLLKDTIPDLSWRHDEIGELSVAFREMTDALAGRMDAISHFAADVAHEIKNPLASVKSAVETFVKVSDPVQQKKLLAVLVEDINRLNRLITDISNASRLDADLARAEREPVDMAAIIRGIVELAVAEGAIPEKINLSLPEEEKLFVTGNDIQLARVMHNLLENALSFVSKEGGVRISAARELDKIVIRIDNDGSTIPENRLETIFERFYTERPAGEEFGLHSGLGLSMSRQIVRAHQGTVFAANIRNENGAGGGVRFTVILPAGSGIA